MRDKDLTAGLNGDISRALDVPEQNDQVEIDLRVSYPVQECDADNTGDLCLNSLRTKGKWLVEPYQWDVADQSHFFAAELIKENTDNGRQSEASNFRKSNRIIVW